MIFNLPFITRTASLCLLVFIQLFPIDSSSERIVGGINAPEGFIPYQLGLAFQNLTEGDDADIEQKCGASLILAPTLRYQLAITAAHCLYDYNNVTEEWEYVGPENQKFSVWLLGGSVELHTYTEMTEVNRAIVHPSYNADGTAHDIALLFFGDKFNLTADTNISTIELFTSSQEFLYGTPSILTISGWGQERESLSESDDVPPSDYLKYVTLPIVNHKLCKEQYEAVNETIEESQICAGLPEGGQDACQGDSGGPAAAWYKNGQKFLVGVTSFGHGCARRDFPGVYASVKYYYNWIVTDTSLRPQEIISQG